MIEPTWGAAIPVSRGAVDDTGGYVLELAILQVAARMRGLGADPYGPGATWRVGSSFIQPDAALITCEVVDGTPRTEA